MKKISKKFLALTMTAMMVSFAFVGCGDTMNDATNGTNATTDTTDDYTGTDNNDVNDQNTNDGAVGGAAEGVGDAVGDVANGVGNAVGDVAHGVGDAVGDVANGIGNAVGDMTSGGFNSYEDAHDYLLGQLGTQDSNASYEVRNMNKQTVAYQNGQNGYQFEIHDTRDGNDTKVGTFYVDQATGKVYKGDENGKNVKEYTFS